MGMIFTSRQIVWAPTLGQDTLTVSLDRTFGDACMAHTEETTQSFADGVWRLMGDKSPICPSNFLDMHNGILPKGIYAGHDGLWLTLDMGTVHSSRRPLTYHGHNEDRFDADRLWLIRAFGAWVDAATAVLDWS